VVSTAQVLKKGGALQSVGQGADGVTYVAPTDGTLTSTGNNSISVAYTNGSQAVTKTVPPGIVCNYILRAL
jgi:hypothetical protein